MKLHKMSVSHDPDNGKYGDCYRTCLACLLDYDDPLSVPHFMQYGHKAYSFDEVYNWLALTHQLTTVMFAISADDVNGVCMYAKEWFPKATYILIGTSPRDEHHAVIANATGIIHDPSLKGGGLIGPCDDDHFWVEFLTPIVEPLQ